MNEYEVGKNAYFSRRGFPEGLFPRFRCRGSSRLREDSTRLHAGSSIKIFETKLLNTEEGGAGPLQRTRAFRLEADDVGGLQALRPAGDFELDGLSFVQRLVSVRLNGGEMNKDVFAGLPLNKAKSLGCVKPLHNTLFFQSNYPFLPLSYLPPWHAVCPSL